MQNEITPLNVSSQPLLPVAKEKVITLKINSGLVLTVVLIILMLVSVAQAVELRGLREKISTGEVKAATATSAPAAASSGGSSSGQSTNLQNLPSMVGGC